MTEKEIKSRLKSINDTVKITKAMQMLSASRSFKIQKAEDFAGDYFACVSGAVDCLASVVSPTNGYFCSGDGKSTLLILAGDKGLCGDYNNAIFQVADKELENDKNIGKIYTLGYVAREYYRGKGVHTDGAYVYIVSEPTTRDANKMATQLMENYKNDNQREVKIIYSKKIGNSTKVFTDRLLPLEKSQNEFDKNTILGEVDVDNMIKQYLVAKLYYIFTQASNAVNYKRMTAMQEATTNGEELVEELTLTYNRTRQEKITNELNDAMAILFGKSV